MHRILSEIIRLAFESPDFVYGEGRVKGDSCRLDNVGACLYTAPKFTPKNEMPEDMTQGCIVGRAILAVYPELAPKLRSVDTTTLSLDAMNFIIDNVHADNLPSEDELRIINKIQAGQDRGLTWKSAVLEGLRY